MMLEYIEIGFIYPNKPLFADFLGVGTSRSNFNSAVGMMAEAFSVVIHDNFNWHEFRSAKGFSYCFISILAKY